MSGASKSLSDDDLLLRFMCDLHAHLPEDQRPMGWSDYSDDQASRARAAFATLRASDSAARAEPVAWDFREWRRKLMELVSTHDSIRGHTTSKNSAWDAIWQHATNIGDGWKARAFLADPVAYEMSEKEVKAMDRALMRSVKFIDGGAVAPSPAEYIERILALADRHRNASEQGFDVHHAREAIRAALSASQSDPQPTVVRVGRIEVKKGRLDFYAFQQFDGLVDGEHAISVVVDASQSDPQPTAPFDPQVRARTLLSYLWRKYDAAGMSMGRGHEAVLLETAMDLLGLPDTNELVDDYGEQVDEARQYLSARRAHSLGFRDPQPAHRTWREETLLDEAMREGSQSDPLTPSADRPDSVNSVERSIPLPDAASGGTDEH